MIHKISLLFICLFNLSYASNLDETMQNWFNQANIVSNTTSGDYVNSQLGVHFLGGSGTTRTTVHSVSPVQVALPSISAGCGGIDYTLGAINIASKDEIKQALKSIASNGIGYAFLLGIETTSPIVANAMKEIQHWANQLNAININSCEIASTLVQSAWPKNTGARNYICSHASTNSPIFKDLIESRHGCRDEPTKRDLANKKAKQTPGFLAGDYNVAWTAIKKINASEENKALFLNLTGTIVVKNSEIKLYPPRTEDIIELLQHGGSIEKAYKIAKNEVDIDEEDLSISVEKSWVYEVSKTLQSIQQKLLSESASSKQSLSDTELNLIRTTRFPLGSLLSVMGQWSGNGMDLASINECANLIAFERVVDYVSQVVTEILNNATSLRAIQIDSDALDKYIHQLQQIGEVVHKLEMKNFQKIAQKHQMIEYLINLDRELRERERGV